MCPHIILPFCAIQPFNTFYQLERLEVFHLFKRSVVSLIPNFLVPFFSVLIHCHTTMFKGKHSVNHVFPS